MKTGYLWIVLLTALPLRAQQFSPLKDPQPVYRNFSVHNGLPSSETYFVHQDREGYIWICTDRGLVRYDGHRFKVFTKKDGLNDNAVFKIKEDRQGRIWFVSGHPGLCYYFKGKIHSFRRNHVIKQKTGGINSPYRDLFFRDDGTMIYNMASFGHIVFYPDGRTDASHWGVAAPQKDKVEVEKIGSDWCVFSRISKKVAKSIEVEKIPFFLKATGKQTYLGKYERQYGIKAQELNDVIFLQNGTDAMCLRNNRVEELPFARNKTIALCKAGNRLCIGMVNDGVALCSLTQEGKVMYREKLLPGLSVTHILRDRDGGYWFSTLENGVYYAPCMQVRNLTVREGLPFINVLKINGVAGNVYASSGGNECKQLNAPWYFGRADVHGKVYHLPRIGNRVLTNDKPILSYLDMGPMTFDQADVYNRGNEIVLSGGMHLVRVYADFSFERIYSSDSSSHDNFSCVAIDDDNTVYAANFKGLHYIGNGKAYPFKGNPLFREKVTDITCHNDWGTVVGTKNVGVYVVRDGKVAMRLTEADGLQSDIINLVAVDEQGKLWIGSNGGMCVVDRQTAKITKLTTHNGLVSNEINDCYFFGNKAWIATKKGVSVVEIGESLKEPGFRPLKLESFELPSGRVARLRDREFENGVAFVKVTFRSLDYRAASIRRFRYRTQKDGAWVYMQSPEVLLTDPKSGEYTLEVSYLNISGEWSPPVTLTRFTVLLPYYARWYVVTLLILLGMGGMYLLFRLRLRQINRRNQLQKTINSLEQKALRAQMNPHFIFNSLNSIQSFLLYEENEKAEKYLLRFAHLIRQTLNNSRESCIPIESEIETLRGYLALEQMRFKEKFTFEIVCLLSPEELQYGVPPMLIQPFVENAVLHGFKTMETGGRIEVRFEKLENQRLLCIVEDNGIGRKATMSAKPEGHKSFGTKITEERLAAFRQKYGDEFSIETIDKEQDGSPAGTKVVMRIPVVDPEELEGSEAF